MPRLRLKKTKINTFTVDRNLTVEMASEISPRCLDQGMGHFLEFYLRPQKETRVFTWGFRIISGWGGGHKLINSLKFAQHLKQNLATILYMLKKIIMVIKQRSNSEHRNNSQWHTVCVKVKNFILQLRL